MKSVMYAMLFILVISLTGCEDPITSSSTPPTPNYARFKTSNSQQSREMPPVFLQPVAEDGIVQCDLGKELSIVIQGGRPPYKFDIHPALGRVLYKPEDSFDDTSFIFLPREVGRCVIEVQDQKRRSDSITVEIR